MAITELKVFLQKIEYLGAGQRSIYIGDDLTFVFVKDGEEVKIKPKPQLKFGESRPFYKMLFYKRLNDGDFPYEIDIKTQVIEWDLATNDLNINPVPTEDFIVKKGLKFKQTDPPVQILVSEDSDPKKNPGVFKVHFRAELNQLEKEEEPTEEAGTSTEGEGTTPNSSGGTGSPTSHTPFGQEWPFDIPFGHYVQSIVKEDMDILAFVSDTHIGADECVDDFSKEDDAAFASMIKFIMSLKSKSKELILLGDLLELWETKPHFKDVGTLSGRIDAAKTKISKIVRKHRPVFSALKTFSNSHKVTYVYGNHDDELQVADVRGHFKKVSGVNADFGLEYSNGPFEVFAQHGHQYDKHNYTTNPMKNMPVGRWIVEDFIVPMEEIKVNGMCGQFSPVDSFEKVQDFIDYVDCLKTQKVISKRAFNQVDKIVKNMNNNVPITGISNVMAGAVNKISAILQAAKFQSEMDQFKLAAGIVEFFNLGIKIEDDDYKSHFNGTDRSCVLMGHTHEGFIKRMGASKVFVNTGTWQEKLIANKSHPCQPKRDATRHLTLLIKRTSMNEVSGEELTYPEGTEVVEVLMFSVSPGGATKLEQSWYYLDP